jgi:lactate dehydrogenase-like 2-hydroxyacid dehydrogenase
MDAAPNLKFIGVLATAFGKIDVEYAKKKGIVVSYLPGYSTEAVAEFTIAALLEQLRELERGKLQARKGNYSEAGFKASEIKGKRFGVLGLGNIGRRVAELAMGFDADVYYWSRNRRNDAEKSGITYCEADELIANCDFVSINLAHEEEINQFFNAKRVKSLKKNAIVINTAPNELIDFDALEERLKTGDVTYVLDHSDELLGPDVKRLSKYKHCIIYPPIGYVTNEARTAKQEMFVGNAEAFLKDSPQNQVPA